MAYGFQDLSQYSFQTNAELELAPRSSPEMSRNQISADFENPNLHPNPPWSNPQIGHAFDSERNYPTADRSNDMNTQYDGRFLFQDAPTRPDYSYNHSMDSESEPSASSSRTMRRKELFAGPAPSDFQDGQIIGTFGTSSGAVQETFTQYNDILPATRRPKRRREDSPGSESHSAPHERQQTGHGLSDEDHGESTFQQTSHSDRDSDTEAVAPVIDRKGKGKVQSTYKGKGKERALEPDDSLVLVLDEPIVVSSSTKLPEPPVADAKPLHEPLSSYTCPICFSAPTNATLTPCGHICCGECLFTAVKTTIHRATLAGADDASEARCPICRAAIPGWDGKGGGVIGLKPRAIFSL